MTNKQKDKDKYTILVVDGFFRQKQNGMTPIFHVLYLVEKIICKGAKVLLSNCGYTEIFDRKFKDMNREYKLYLTLLIRTFNNTNQCVRKMEYCIQTMNLK